MTIAGWIFLGGTFGIFAWLALFITFRGMRPWMPGVARASITVFWLGAAGVLLMRFTKGLGPISNMTDGFPWGVWIGLLQSGVALAAGGFVIAATVHIFHIRRFEPILRPMVLTAFLGYSFVAMTLFIEVGRPYRLWHPLVMWQHNSIMFEVAWCVTLYITVLAVEFSPVIFEHMKMPRAVHALHVAAIPIVIAGVILSTLHQSSMGSMYLAMPQKIYPLWFSPLLPVFFLVSAVAVGLCMAIIESFFSHKIFGRSLEIPLLVSLARAARTVLFLYLGLRLVDITARGVWIYFLRDPWMSASCIAEIGGGVLLPALLFSSRRVRAHVKGMVFASLLAGFGVILNRLNVSWLSMIPYTQTQYFPTWMELTISFFLVTATVVLFGAAVRFLPVFPDGPVEAQAPKQLSSRRV